MKISYNWLKDYLQIDLPADQAAQVLTDIGLEVEKFEVTGGVEGGFEGLVVGEVLTAEQHPNADRLRVTTVNVGGEEPLNIVCGAPNVAAGQKVVVATVGTMLYPLEGDPFKIKKGKIRGEVSMGMICAEDEIGMGTDHDGIIELDTDAPPGTPVKEVIQLETDEVFEIGLTPNRSDATNHVGVAKDLAAALQILKGSDKKVVLPAVDGFKVSNNALPIAVEVQNTEACPRYVGVSISGVKVGESPEWMQKRLMAIGVRPINNIVDITNFILHELGQPLHAFDADKIAGNKVIVRCLPQDTEFVTLDEQTRKLHAEDLIICDGDNKPMCIAGVFGGLNSGVTEQTTNIFLESARFHPIRTRRTSARHLLRTDAAIRFEKGVDPNNCLYALKRAALLITELAGGAITSEVVDVYPTPVERPLVKVRYKRVNQLIGVDIPKDTVKNILTALDIQIQSEDEESLQVAVGTERADVLREVDVIEEILRIYGFNSVPIPETLKSSLSYSNKPDSDQLTRKIADLLVSDGFYQSMGTSITNSKYYEEGDNSIVPLMNSLNANMDVMRSNMLFSGLEAILHNQNHKQSDIRFYEFGKTYAQQEVENDGQSSIKYSEQTHLSLFLTGNLKTESWDGKTNKVSFFDLKESVQRVLSRLGIRSFQSQEADASHLAYGLTYQLGKQRPLVTFGSVKRTILKQFGIKNEVYYADIQWDQVLKVVKKQKTTYQEIPKYPSVRRDLAMLLDKEVAFGKIEAIAKSTVKQLLRNVNLFDIFDDESKLGEGKKSYAVSFLFQDERKTLTDKEVDKVMKKLIHRVQTELGAEIR